MRKRRLARAIVVALSLWMMAFPGLAAEAHTPIQERPVTEQPPVSAEPPEETAPMEAEPPPWIPQEEPPAPETSEPSTDTSNPVEGTKGYPLRQDHVKYMNGFPQGTFQPDLQLTRAQAAQVIYCLLAEPDSGTGACTYTDVPDDQWYAHPVRALCALGLLENGTHFRPEDIITRAEFVDLLVCVNPQEPGSAAFRDVPSDYWAAQQISTAASQGWISGYPDGTFYPDSGLSRAEACTIINQMLGRVGDGTQTKKLLTLGLFSDVTPSHWAAAAVTEAAVSHNHIAEGGGEVWTSVDLAELSLQPGFHDAGGQLYYADRHGKLAVDENIGAFYADSTGLLTQMHDSYQIPQVPYISQIDNIGAWVGCEAVATLMGLQAKGYALHVPLKNFLDHLPRHSSNPEKGFVGSPYVPDLTKQTRTTIYPAKLAEYANSYFDNQPICADFRGASITDLRRELLAGNSVVAYVTLWWKPTYYRNFNIEGTDQRLVSNNHAVLVCGYDPERGYFISDPYNYHNRGEVHQYWQDAATFEAIWNERQVGMVLR